MAFQTDDIGKLAEIMELYLRQTRLMEMRRLLVEVPGAMRTVGDEALDSGALGGVERTADRTKHSRLFGCAVAVAALTRMVDRAAHRRRTRRPRRTSTPQNASTQRP